MKTLILILLLSCHSYGAWFTKEKPDTTDRDRRIEAEVQLKEANARLRDQQHATQQWQIATGSLSVGCIILLVVGTALGAKVRRSHEN